MEWSLDIFGAQTTKIWPFEAARALGTAIAAKAPRGLDGLPKQKCVLEVPESNNIEGSVDDPREYYRGGVVSLLTSKCSGMTQGSLGVVWLVYHGDSHTQRSRCGGQALKDG